jgi:hypothetical protein
MSFNFCMAKKAAPKKTAAKTPPPQRRKFTRFAPDPGAFALICGGAYNKKINPPIPCLIVEEAYGGVGLVAIADPMIKKNAILEFQVGKLPKMKGEIRWVKQLEGRLAYFGVNYLED